MGTSELFQSVTDDSVLHFEKCEKPNNDGPCYAVTLLRGEEGEGVKGSPDTGNIRENNPDGNNPDGNNPHGNNLDGNIPTSNLPQRIIVGLAEEYMGRACANYRETGGDTRTTELDAWLRQRLAEEGVSPEHIEVEFRRVVATVLGGT